MVDNILEQFLLTTLKRKFSIFLIFGGLVTTYLALDKVAELNGQHGLVDGFNYMINQSGDHFHMILKKDNASFPSLPGLTVLLGGMWIVNLNYSKILNS